MAVIKSLITPAVGTIAQTGSKFGNSQNVLWMDILAIIMKNVDTGNKNL
jgi:hypothetical protein